MTNNQIPNEMAEKKPESQKSEHTEGLKEGNKGLKMSNQTRYDKDNKAEDLRSAIDRYMASGREATTKGSRSAQSWEEATGHKSRPYWGRESLPGTGLEKSCPACPAGDGKFLFLRKDSLTRISLNWELEH